MTEAAALPTHDTDQSIEFLRARGGIAVLSCVWIHAAGKKGMFETISHPIYDQAGLEAARKWIDVRQGHANLYYSVNPPMQAVSKKMEREDLKALVSLHVDLDPRQGESQEEAQVRIAKRLKALEKPPTWIINSGGGVQGIWDLTEPVPIDGNLDIAEDLKQYNRKLEQQLGGDHCHDVTRIMRLPGTINLPDEKKIKKQAGAGIHRAAAQHELHVGRLREVRAGANRDHYHEGRQAGDRNRRANRQPRRQRIHREAAPLGQACDHLRARSRGQHEGLCFTLRGGLGRCKRMRPLWRA